MDEEELKEILGKIVSDHVMNNGVKVNEDFRALVVSVKYLASQIPIALRNSEEDDKEYGQTVLKELKNILLKVQH